MRVLYQENLSSLAHALSNMGFEMHPMGADIAADAVLFTTSSHRALKAKPGAGGAFLLNAKGLSAAQAAQALRRRSQMPLF